MAHGWGGGAAGLGFGVLALHGPHMSAESPCPGAVELGQAVPESSPAKVLYVLVQIVQKQGLSALRSCCGLQQRTSNVAYPPPQHPLDQLLRICPVCTSCISLEFGR